MDERFKEAAVQAKIAMCSEPRLEDLCKRVVQLCIDDLMEMHKQANGENNYYHFAANKLKESYKV